MTDAFEGIVDRFVTSSSHFASTLDKVQPEQWAWATPCTEWNVRQLVNHQTRANGNFVVLVEGGAKDEFVRLRDIDALGDDPINAYALSVNKCADAFGQSGALHAMLDYPLGPIRGEQALALRTTDSTIHTWDLARAIGANEMLDADLVAWIEANLDEIYAGLPEMPNSAETTNRFVGAPDAALAVHESPQDRLLRLTGRHP